MEKNTAKAKGKYSHLSLTEREEISIDLEKGMKQYTLSGFHCTCSLNSG